MYQNFNLGPVFCAMAQRAQNGLKMKKWNISYSFGDTILPFSDLIDQNFNLGPGFRAMPQKAQIGLKLTN